MKKILAAAMLASGLVTSSFAADTAVKPPVPDANGAISTKEYLNFLEHELKPKLFGDEKTLACYKLKQGAALDKAYAAVARTCKSKTLKDIPPKIRGQFEMRRVEGPFGSCLEVTMRNRQKLSQQHVYECLHGKPE